MTDCLIVGFNDWDFAGYVDMVAAMGTDSGAYRDLALAFVELEGRPARALDVLTAFRPDGGQRPYHNTDFLWPTITCLGSFLTRRGFSVDYVNMFHLEKERLRARLRHGDVRTVAIATTLYVIAEPILDIVRFIRSESPGVTIIVGGPYIRNQTTSADAASMRRIFTYIGADVYVDSGEGELALSEVLAALRDGRTLAGVANVAYRAGDDYVVNPGAVESNALADNPVDYQRFSRDLGEFVSLRTAKSCPFSCAFCGFPQRAGAYTYLPVELVERELDALRALGTVTTLTFLDDTFNVPKRRFKDILRMMIRHRYPFRWNCFYRSDHGDDEAIALMGEAGCEGVFLGVESGSAVMLERMNKTARPEDYLKAIPRLREAGISTYASLIVGYPGETFETVRQTVDFLEEARPDFFRAQLWYADHMTPIWGQRDTWRIEGEGFNWRHATMDSATASDLVEKMFLAVAGSVWMPQYGFEQWSTFYLQRRGMTLDQVKTFVTAFNQVIKARLLAPSTPAPPPRLMDALRASALFDRPGAHAAIGPERFPAAAYVAAEQFWTAVFRAPAAISPAARLRDPDPAAAAGEAEAAALVDAAAVTAAVAGTGVEPATLWLAVFTCVLSRVSGQPDMAVRAALDGASALPLRCAPAWEDSLAAYAARLRAHAAEARAHGEYAAAIVFNPVRMREAGTTVPAIEIGYEHGGPAPGLDAGRPSPGVPLALRVTATAEGTHLRLRYDGRGYRAEAMQALLACCGAVVREIAGDPQAVIGALGLGDTPAMPPPACERLEGETFNFEG